MDPVQVRVYVFTGWHTLFKIPESWCRECQLFVRVADRAAAEAGVPVEVRPVSWWWRVLGALRFGGYHPPVMVVDGRRIAQGHDVPSMERVVDAIHAAAAKRGHDVPGQAAPSA